MLIGYARVSKGDQDEALQLDALQAAGVDRLLVDRMSGARRDRPELARALDLLRAGDVLVIWKLDRFGRSLRDLIELADRLQATGAELRSLTEQLDTSTPAGRFFYQVLGAVAEFERGMIQERTRAGLAAARARGARPGRKPGLSPDQVKAAASLLADPANGLTVEGIAQLFGVSPATLYRHLPGGRLAVQRG